MTLEAFTLLDEKEQAQVLIDKGVFIAERIYRDFSIFLYQVDHFYVEIYHNLRYNVIQGMESFEDEEMLQPYLESIDLSTLCL